MPSNYDSIDLKFSWNGDFLPGDNGDLGDTSDDQIQTLLQDIHTVVASALGDWDEHPNLGAALGDFIGESNSRETAGSLRKRVRSALTNNNVVRDEDLSIRLVPVSLHEVLIILKIDAIPTDNNSLEVSSIKTSLVFDYYEKGVFFSSR